MSACITIFAAPNGWMLGKQCRLPEDARWFYWNEHGAWAADGADEPGYVYAYAEKARMLATLSELLTTES